LLTFPKKVRDSAEEVEERKDEKIGSIRRNA